MKKVKVTELNDNRILVTVEGSSDECQRFNITVGKEPWRQAEVPIFHNKEFVLDSEGNKTFNIAHHYLLEPSDANYLKFVKAYVITKRNDEITYASRVEVAKRNLSLVSTAREDL